MRDYPHNSDLNVAQDARVFSDGVVLWSYRRDNSGMILRYPNMTDEEIESKVRPVLECFGDSFDEVVKGVTNQDESDDKGVTLHVLDTTRVVENPRVLDDARRLVDAFYSYEELNEL